MEVEQYSNITSDIDAQILEELQTKKKLIDRQLQILCELEIQTKEELAVWEEKCKNLRQIYNYYNYSQAQYPRNLIQKEPTQNAKFIQAEIQIQSQEADQVQEISQVQQPLPNQAINKLEKKQIQENKVQSGYTENKKSDDSLIQTKITHMPSAKQEEVQSKKVALKNVQIEYVEFEDDFEEQKENSNKTEFKILKTPLNSHQKKIIPPAKNIIQELNNRVEKKIKNQNKKFTFPKDQIIASSEDTQQHKKLDSFKTFENYMEKYIKKFQDDSPQSIAKQIHKAKKIKTILRIPDEKLIITPKWLKQFKIQISKNCQ
ncbi:hypothetical protein ABPG72_001668 [Tetrahymena utriculariae]